MVNSRKIAALLVLSAAIAVACVSSPVLAPSDGQILLDANPLTIVLDEFATPPVTVGTALVSAQILDTNGIPQADVSVFFSSNGGSLTSVPPGQVATALKTDDSGFVTDTLTVQLGDPDSISVTVRSGPVSASIAVEKEEAQPNRPPFAFIDISPGGSALLNEVIILDASASDDPDGDAITCYQWLIETFTNITDPDLACPTNPNARCEVSQGKTTTLITRDYPDEQPMYTVTLRVTDDPNVNCPDIGPALPAASFNAIAAEPYQVVCERSNPTAGASPTQPMLTLTGNPPTASVLLSGATSFASNANSPIVSYAWTCGNGDSFATESAPCTYTSTGTFFAQLTVTSQCGGTDTADVLVTVN